MPDRSDRSNNSFELTAYLEALGASWKTIALVMIAAAAVAFAGSLLLPYKYESTVLLMIQPGVSGGPSYPAAMNPAYLESLRSYEQFVQSDGLLAKMLQETRFDQSPNALQVENFRRSALRVALVRGTKILQVSVLLNDPKQAHDVALRLAQLAVEANSGVGRAEIDQVRNNAEQEVQDARKPLAAAQSALEQFRRDNRMDELSRQMEQLIERKVRYQGQLNDADVGLAEQEVRLATLTEQIAKEPEKYRLEQRGQPSDVLNPVRQELRQQSESVRTEIAGLRARRDALRGSLASLDTALAKSQATLASLQARSQTILREYELAERRYGALSNRATDSSISASTRHEDLRIIDSGVVPSRPVSPRPLLNFVLAAFLGFLAAILYETWNWNVRRVRSEGPTPLPVAERSLWR